MAALCSVIEGGTTEAISLKTGDYFVVRSSLLVMTTRISQVFISHLTKVDNQIKQYPKKEKTLLIDLSGDLKTKNPTPIHQYFFTHIL